MQWFAWNGQIPNWVIYTNYTLIHPYSQRIILCHRHRTLNIVWPVQCGPNRGISAVNYPWPLSFMEQSIVHMVIQLINSPSSTSCPSFPCACRCFFNFKQHLCFSLYLLLFLYVLLLVSLNSLKSTTLLFLYPAFSSCRANYRAIILDFRDIASSLET